MSVVERYLELGLRVGRHVPGLVDAYFGPPGLNERVDGEELREPAALSADAAELHEDLGAAGLEPQRTRWLRAQTIGMQTVARRLAGEPIGYIEEIELCYGVAPTRTPEASFEAAHQMLEDVLPGDGDLAARYEAWLAHSVPADKQLEVLQSINDELRGRVLDLFGLPEGESVEYEVAGDVPWTGFNYYEGGLRSRVAINLDIPLPAADFARFVAHETYPGHHTEHAFKEAMLVREAGQLEPTIVLTATPESIVSEGLAELGYKLLFPDLHRLTSEHLARVGVDYDAEVGEKVTAARETLGEVATNAALMLHEDGVPLEEARSYALRWSLTPEYRVDKTFDFITDPVWRTYLPSYTEGERLCRAFVGEDPARFRRLLTEQLTSADLVPAS